MAPAVRADTAAIQRCRVIAEAPARLACYDAIALPGLGSRAGWGAPVGSPAPAPAAASATTGAARSPAAIFGLPGRVLSAEGGDRLDSRIPGPFEGWEPNTRFTLANGQVWQVIDGSRAVYSLQDPKITITRGVIGGFYMSIEGVAQTPTVRRVQ